ncbi:MAG: hypothetical protein WC202_12230 [Desulfobacterales bacterium]
MALRDLLKGTERPIKTDFQRVATATIATTATKRPKNVRTVATVAKIAVAEPGKGKTDRGRITETKLGRAEAVFNFLADQGRACSESEILAAVAGDESENRNTLYKLAAERVIDYLGRGEYQVDAPKVELPSCCPLRTGGKVPKGCCFHPKFIARMLESGTLKHGGPCPLVRVCTHTTLYKEGVV